MDEVKRLKKFKNKSRSTLKKITELKNKLNYFEITKKEKDEIVHSNVLAWLFDPQGNHNLQTTFLKQFTSKIKLRLTGNQMKNTQVKREYNLAGKRKDILITDYSTYFIAIENKIKASQENEQLEGYYNLLMENFWYIPESNRYYYFLTPKGDKPNHAKWKIIDYNLILEILTKILEKQSLNISNQTKEFLEQYIIVLGRDVLKRKDEVKELCMQLYQKHKEALDLIYEFRMEKYLIVNKGINDIISEYDNLFSMKSESTKVKFTSRRIFNAFENKFSKDSRYVIGSIYFEFQIDYEHSKKIILFLKSYLKSLNKDYLSSLKSEINKNKKLFPKINKIEDINEDGWCTLWDKEVLSQNEYRELTVEEIREKLEETIRTFSEELLPDYNVFFENFFKTHDNK